MKFILLLAAASLCLLAQSSPDVGSGVIDPVIRQQFVSAYFRNGFAYLVSTPPVADVRNFGSTGLIQEFNDAARTSGVRLALIKSTRTTVTVEGVPDVAQVMASMFAYYNTIGVGTAGFPLMDTGSCPGFAANTCFWQLFDKKYALFVYTNALAGGSTFTLKDPFYTSWAAAGGISVIGPATSAETAVTSASGAAGTYQTYQSGMVFNMTAGTQTGQVISVREPVFATYIANGGPTGSLGLPLGPEIAAGTRRRQSFEGGLIEYEPGQGAIVRLPVANISLSYTSTSLRLKLNETFSLEAFPRNAAGDLLSDRTVVWTTTNGRVVTVQSNGRAGVLKAVGGGTATVTAVSEGKSSAPIQVFVDAPCCQVGEGAPTATAVQAFSDAVTRNRLVLQLPSPAPVRRAGTGYIQELTGTNGVRYLIALPDRSPQAWVVSGSLLGRYTELDGPAGILGYPGGDATAGGRQLFDGGALAGSPIQVVTGTILSRWALLSYETGAIGAPAGPASVFTTFAATSGVQQPFRSGLILHLQSGANLNRALVVSGPILARYLGLGGAAGNLGAPVNEEFAISDRRRQDFEGGYMEYVAGTTNVEVTENARKPQVSVLPATVVAGSRIRIAAGGFANQSRLRVSLTGQADFVVQTQNGSYSWDVWVPADTTSRTVAVRAVDMQTGASAEASYTIRAAAEARPRLTKVRGDTQVAAPGVELPVGLRVSLRDESNNPLVGVTVTFAASPGAQVSPRTAQTDINGEAETRLRLPAEDGVALATAEALRQLVTFSARAAGSSISNFPRVTFEGDAYVASAAAILKYYQDRSEIALGAGPATPAALDSYLRNFCVFDAQANQICDGYVGSTPVPNLWRLPAYASGSLEVAALPATEQALREAIGQGSPVLVSLRLASGEAHAVVATGAGGGGGIQIMDPHPRQSRALLGDYTAAGASLAGAVRLLPRPPVTPGFVLYARTGTVQIASPSGPCGTSFTIPAGEQTMIFQFCDGQQSAYQLELTAPDVYRGHLADLSAGGQRFELTGLRSGFFRVFRPGTQWELGPLEISLAAGGVVNAASFGADFAPGGIISVFGVGLARAGSETKVELGGLPATVLFATPFQLNVALPLDLGPGTWPLRLVSPFGSAEIPIDLRDAAPAVFRLSETQAALTNQDGSVNAPNNPAQRGQVVVAYGTGFGAVTATQGNLRPVGTPVTASVGGVELRTVYAGLTPGFTGLYQLNLQLPADLPPGLFQAIQIRQGGVFANPIPIAIR